MKEAMLCIVGWFWVSAQSRAFIPNSEEKNDSGSWGRSVTHPALKIEI